MKYPPLNLYNMWQLNPLIRDYDDIKFYHWNYWFLLDDYYNNIKK